MMKNPKEKLRKNSHLPKQQKKKKVIGSPSQSNQTRKRKGIQIGKEEVNCHCLHMTYDTENLKMPPKNC